MRSALRAAMIAASLLRSDEPDLLIKLEQLQSSELDEVTFGVIGFGSDSHACVVRYGAYEAKRSGLTTAGVVGLPFFSVVAQCMNNFLVAQRFADAKADHTRLDATLDYVLTLRMRPTPVTLRLLFEPNCDTRYVVVVWPSERTKGGQRVD